MNTYHKFCPNVFLAKCDEKHEKGEVIEVTIKNIMKVDFTKFPLFTGIDKQDMVIADIRKDIADGIYRNVPGLPAHVLAEKIYRNELVELADDEIHILDLYTSASVGQLADSWQDYKKNNLETETGK